MPSTQYAYLEGLLKTATFGVPNASPQEVTTYGYWPDGRTKTVLGPDGRTSSYQYGPRGFVKGFTYGKGTDVTSTTYTRDARGEIATETYGAGTPDAKTWGYAYGARGELLSVTQPDGMGDFVYAYDALLRLTKVTPPTGSETPEESFAYDFLGRQTRKARGSAVWSTTWDQGVETAKSPLGDVTTTLFDGRGRPVQTTYTPSTGSSPYSDLEQVDREYTAEDQPWKVEETRRAGNVTESYVYGPRRLLQSLTRGSEAVGYTYTDSGRRQTVTSPLGTVTYGYGPLGRVNAVTGPAGVTALTWEPGGARLEAISSTGLTERRCYDGRGGLSAVVNAGQDVSYANLTSPPSVTGLRSYFGYQYDGRGNRVSETYLDGALTVPETTHYGYDGADWLTGVLHPNGSATLYQLAADGTRTGEKLFASYSASLGPSGYETPGTPTKALRYIYDAQGGLEAVYDDAANGAQVAAYTTDLAGRVTSAQTAAGTKDFDWSDADRLTEATFTPALPGGGDGTPTTIGFAYDANGLRRSRTVNGGTTSYLWAQGQLLEENFPGNPLRYTNAGGLAVAAGANRLAHDGLGSIVGLVGATTKTRRYDAWGSIRTDEPGWSTPSATEPSLAYAGQYADATLGLSYAQQRYYDPEVGRFLSNDPLGATAVWLMAPVGLNPWLYANGNSMRFLDPAGTRPRTKAEQAVLNAWASYETQREASSARRPEWQRLLYFILGSSEKADVDVLEANIRNLSAAIERARKGEAVLPEGRGTHYFRNAQGKLLFELPSAPNYVTASEAQRATNRADLAALEFTPFATVGYGLAVAGGGNRKDIDSAIQAGGTFGALLLPLAGVSEERGANAKLVTEKIQSPTSSLDISSLGPANSASVEEAKPIPLRPDVDASPGSATTPPEKLFGPFYRVPHDPTEYEKVSSSGELGGRPPRNMYQSDIPRAKAYAGPLPEGEAGYEFYSPIGPRITGTGERSWYGDQAASEVVKSMVKVPCLFPL